MSAADEPVRMGVVELERITAHAIQVTTAKARQVWIPMSAVHDDSEVFGVGTDGQRQTVGERGELVLRHGWAEAKGWVR